MLQVHPAKGTYDAQGQENTSSAHYMFQKYLWVTTVRRPQWEFTHSHSTGSSHQTCHLIETENLISHTSFTQLRTLFWQLIPAEAWGETKVPRPSECPCKHPRTLSFTSHNQLLFTISGFFRFTWFPAGSYRPMKESNTQTKGRWI